MTLTFSTAIALAALATEMLRLAVVMWYWMPFEVKIVMFLLVLMFHTLIDLMYMIVRGCCLVLGAALNSVSWSLQWMLRLALSTGVVGFPIAVGFVHQTIPKYARSSYTPTSWFLTTIILPACESFKGQYAEPCFQCAFEFVTTGTRKARVWCQQKALPLLQSLAEWISNAANDLGQWCKRTLWPVLKQSPGWLAMLLWNVDDSKLWMELEQRIDIHRDFGRNPLPRQALYKTGEKVWYVNSKQNNVPARVLAVHPDVDDVLYTLKVEGKDNDSETQTIESRLLPFRLQAARFEKGSLVSYYDKSQRRTVDATVVQVTTCPFGGEASYDILYDGKERNTLESNLSVAS